MNSTKYHFENGNGQHAHFLGDRPLIGTTRVSGILAKPLSWWASGLAVQTFGCVDPKVLTRIKNRKATQEEILAHRTALESFLRQLKNMSLDDYMSLIDTAYRAHDARKRETAVAGTDLHAELEKFVKDHMAGRIRLYPDEIRPFIGWTYDNVKRFLWSEGHCYSEKMWVGGISDAGYQDKDGNYGIIDFKSAKDAYFEHFCQLGGYDIQITENGIFNKEGVRLYKPDKPFSRYAVVPFGAKEVYPRFSETAESFQDSPAKAREVFLAMLAIYKAMPSQD